jgi:hypothetical protein
MQQHQIREYRLERTRVKGTESSDEITETRVQSQECRVKSIETRVQSRDYRDESRVESIEQ